MLFPNARRNNARHRGPMESWKLDAFHTEARRNLQAVKEKFDSLQGELDLIHQQTESREAALGKQRINQLHDRLENIKGAVK